MSRRNPKAMLAIGPLSARSQNMPHYVGGQDFSDVQHHKVCNASMPNLTQAEARRLQMLAPPSRPGSEDHRRYSSKGPI